MSLLLLNSIGIIGLLIMGILCLNKPMLLWSANAVHMISAEQYKRSYSKVLGSALIVLAVMDLVRIG